MGTGHAHNDYLHVAVQTGILGLLSWLAIWITFFYYGFKHTKDETRNKDDRIITSGIMLSISGILVAALFQCYFVDLENSILWWVLIGTALQILNKKTNSRIKEIPNR